MRGNVPDDDGPVKGAGDDAAGALVGHRLGREGHARQVGRVVPELLVRRAREVLYICIYIYIYTHTQSRNLDYPLRAGPKQVPRHQSWPQTTSETRHMF